MQLPLKQETSGSYPDGGTMFLYWPCPLSMWCITDYGSPNLPRNAYASLAQFSKSNSSTQRRPLERSQQEALLRGRAMAAQGLHKPSKCEFESHLRNLSRCGGTADTPDLGSGAQKAWRFKSSHRDNTQYDDVTLKERRRHDCLSVS